MEEPDPGHIVPDASGGTEMFDEVGDVTSDGEEGLVDEREMVMIAETEV